MPIYMKNRRMNSRQEMPIKTSRKEDGIYAQYKDGTVELLMTNQEYEEENKLYPENKDFLRAYDEDKLNEFFKSINVIINEKSFKSSFPSKTYRT
jgi:hypothetical protein